MLSLPLVVFTEPLDFFPLTGRAEHDAAEAFGEMERRHVPLVFASRGTRTEVEFVRRKINNQHPFITENGGGLFVPEGHFRERPKGAETIRHYHKVSLARPYSEACEALEEMAEKARVEVMGFHQMSAREVAENSGLPARIAEASRLREFDEPFFFVGEEVAASKRLAEVAKPGGWRVARGERFWHFSGGADVAAAMRQLMEMYRTARHARVRALAIGSSRYDLAMLAGAGRAVVLPDANGAYDPEITDRMPAARQAAMGGAAGWNAAVLEALGVGE